MVLTQEWLDECLGFWMEILTLSTWDIKIRWCSLDELNDCYGDHRFNLLRRKGSIRVVSESLGKQDNETWNPEATIIHELLHLHLSLVTDVSNVDLNETMEERFINDMAAAMLRLKNMATMAAAMLRLKNMATEVITSDKKKRSIDSDGGTDRPVKRRKKVGKKSGKRRRKILSPPSRKPR